MRHAVLIMTHGDMAITEQCLRALDDKRFDFYIHIDKKTQIENLQDGMLGICKYSRVVLTERIPVYWGHHSVTRALIVLLKACINSKYDYDYIHLLSGTDLPLKTPDEIDSFFEKHEGSEFIRIWDSNGEQNGEANWRMKYRYPLVPYYKRTRFKCLNDLQKLIISRIIRFPRKKGTSILRDSDYRVFCGEQWFSITSEFARHILRKADQLIPYFEDCYCADECFVATIIKNSPEYKKRLSGIFTRKIDFSRGDPYIWKNTDFDYGVLTQTNSLFARKFSTAHFDIVERLIQEIEHRRRQKKDNACL